MGGDSFHTPGRIRSYSCQIQSSRCIWPTSANTCGRLSFCLLHHRSVVSLWEGTITTCCCRRAERCPNGRLMAFVADIGCPSFNYHLPKGCQCSGIGSLHCPPQELLEGSFVRCWSVVYRYLNEVNSCLDVTSSRTCTSNSIVLTMLRAWSAPSATLEVRYDTTSIQQRTIDVVAGWKHTCVCFGCEVGSQVLFLRRQVLSRFLRGLHLHFRLVPNRLFMFLPRILPATLFRA